MPLTPDQLKRFNDLIAAGQLSAAQIVAMVKQYAVDPKLLTALNQPENADKLNFVMAAVGASSPAAATTSSAAATPAPQQPAPAQPNYTAAPAPKPQPSYTSAPAPQPAQPKPELKPTLLTDEQLRQLNNQISMLSGQQIVQMMAQYNISIEHLPALGKKENADKMRFVETQLLTQREQLEWQRVQEAGNNASAMPVMREYLNRWRSHSFAATRVKEVEQRMQVIQAQQSAIYRNQEESEWQQLLQAPTIGSLAAHADRWIEKGIDLHFAQADAKAWELVLASRDSLTKALEYLRLFGDNALHAADVRQVEPYLSEWEAMKANADPLAIMRFLAGKPHPLMANEARNLLHELKLAELQRMHSELDMYPGERLLELLHRGVFTEDELIQAGMASNSSLQILRNITRIKDMLPNLVDVQAECKTSCVPRRTDVYLFGTPATGKTCILMGILGSDHVYFNAVAAAGEYALSLKKYLKAGLTPGQTEEGFVATVQSKIVIREGIEHHVNLVELAGEDFAMNVARPRNGVISFAEMGKGVPELLANNNRKVFFIIIDPTSKALKITKTVPVLDANGRQVYDEYGQPKATAKTFIVDQADSLQRLIDMLSLPENSHVLNKVDAIHVIVTKGDKLGDSDNRAAEARKLLRSNYPGFIDELVRICKRHKINRHSNPSHDGVPRLFTFSLGRFYPGGIYEYDPSDANQLTTVIASYTPV